MLKKSIVLFSVFALVIALVPALVIAQGQGNNQGRFIVVFDHELNSEARNALQDVGGQVLGELNLINGFSVLLPEKAVNRIGALPGVLYVEPDVIVNAIHHRPGHDKGGPGGDEGEEDTNQPPQTTDWGVERIQAPQSWATSTGSGVNVAVVDTGIALNHPDLNVAVGVTCTHRVRDCFAGGDDDNGHGTHVAGTIAALNNDIGVVGVSHGANLFAVKVLDRNGSGFLSHVIRGIDWSVNNGADVINMSLGTTTFTQSLQDAVDAAYASGVVLVAAAGNNGDLDNNPSYPAAHESVIAVGATDSEDNLAWFSNTGDYVELVAPGVDINSTWKGGGYFVASGTSMASPHVAGSAALILASGNYTNVQVRGLLLETAEALLNGYNLVDVYNAVGL